MSVSSALAQLVVPVNLAIALVIAGCLFFIFRRRKSAFSLFLGAALWVLVWSLPATSLFLGGVLEQRYPHLPAEQNPTAQAIIVLGGHTAANRHNWFEPLDLLQSKSRVERAAQLYHAGRAPLIIVSGAALDGGTSEAQGMAKRLRELNVPAEAIIMEESSHTTRENALYTARHLQELGIEQSLLVTSALHMPRSMASFSRFGPHFIPAPVRPQIVRPQTAHFSPWRPSWHTLYASRSIIKEYLGLLVYWARGWV
ncbi:MAG TPA: YdcF family protein [Paenalcaligenes sp.]|nr:YdcF family protein [Paenalcaligenes sp.]